MSVFEKLNERQTSLAVVGLGYVGMPIAVAFSEKVNVIGYDLNREKIALYRSGIDPTREVGSDVISSCSVQFTDNETRLKEAGFIIVAVPTPVNPDHTPNLEPVIQATRTVGKNLSPGTIVVYESTVYPGVTEEVCVPILEQASGMTCGKDFKVGYSPERINPGDSSHRLATITKIVSGMDEETLQEVAAVYGLVVKAGVYRAGSIRVAEAAKVIENSQRDINIAFMNELSLIFHMMGIDTKEVLEAAGTKWNFLPFRPGLVGGHCIGVDPYYLTYKAEQLGYRSQVILAGRRINDGMGAFVAQQTVKQLIAAGVDIHSARIGILGLTFKENCPDIRNSKVVDIIRELREYGLDPLIADPLADPEEAKREYGLTLTDHSAYHDLDCLIIAVGHTSYASLSAEEINKMLRPAPDGCKILTDVKGLYDKSAMEAAGFRYWRL